MIEPRALQPPTVTFVCPTCHQVIEVPDRRQAPDRPFCSRRCKLIDLGKWLNEEYRIEAPLPQPEPPLER